MWFILFKVHINNSVLFFKISNPFLIIYREITINKIFHKSGNKNNLSEFLYLLNNLIILCKEICISWTNSAKVKQYYPLFQVDDIINMGLN